MGRVQWKGSALLAPVPPALVCCRADGEDNVFTVGWTGIVSTHPPRTYISVRPQRHSYAMLRKSGVFTVNLMPAALWKTIDYCGIFTGARVDKFARTGLLKAQATEIDCPYLAQSALSLECRITEVLPQGTHDMFLAEIVAVSANEALLDKAGRLCLERAGLAAYAHGTYFTLGKPLGRFGDSAKKKKRAPQGKTQTAQTQTVKTQNANLSDKGKKAAPQSRNARGGAPANKTGKKR